VLIASVNNETANAPVDNPSASQHVCSAEWPLPGEPFKESIFFWSRFQRLSCPFSVLKFGGGFKSVSACTVQVKL
jgi:hypothetical protein